MGNDHFILPGFPFSTSPESARDFQFLKTQLLAPSSTSPPLQQEINASVNSSLFMRQKVTDALLMPLPHLCCVWDEIFTS